jgi:hypothetical protein
VDSSAAANVVSVAKAGSAIPVKFSLGGNLGLNVLQVGSPSSASFTCGTAPTDVIEETVGAAASALQYDSLANQYIYVWKTESTWNGSTPRTFPGRSVWRTIMRHPLTLASALCTCLAFTLGACAEAPTGTTAPPRPPLAAATAPSQSGPNVVRFPFAPGVLSGPDAELAVAVGFENPFADHCADFVSPGQPGSTQIVLTPPGGLQAQQSGHDLNVVVFQFAGVVGDYCLDLVGAPVVATGTANLTLTSNDLVFGGLAGPGAHGVQVTIHGVVDLASGGQARLFATTHVLVRPNGSGFDHTRIVLTPL